MMSFKDHVYANLMAFFTSACLLLVLLRSVNGDTQSKFPGVQEFEFYENRSKLSGYLSVIFVGLLMVIVTRRTAKQRLVPGIPIVGGSGIDNIKKNRKRFIHDGKSMLDEGYREVRWET